MGEWEEQTIGCKIDYKDAENKVVVTTGEREGSRGNGRVGGKRGLI